MSPDTRKHDHLREALILVFLAVLIAASKVTLRLPLKMPGHGLLPIIFLMCLGRALTARPWSGAFMGCAAGLICLALGGGFKAVEVFTKYGLVGLALDLLFKVSDPLLHRRGWLLVVWGALATLPRGFDGWIRDLLAGMDILVILAMSAPKLLSGMAFGAVGAALAYQLSKALARRGYVAYPDFGRSSGGPQTTAAGS